MQLKFDDQRMNISKKILYTVDSIKTHETNSCDKFKRK